MKRQTDILKYKNTNELKILNSYSQCLALNFSSPYEVASLKINTLYKSNLN